MQRTHTLSETHGLLCSLVLLLVLGVGLTFGQAGDTPRKGGTLRVAISQPATLDPLGATVAETVTIAQHSLEGLYTLGQDYGPPPLLAAGQTVSDNGLVYTVTLRRGVLFHNGQELTAANAVASLRRLGKLNPLGKAFFTHVDVVTPLDRYTLQLRLHEQTAVVLPLFMWSAVYPKAVLDEAGDGEAQTLIGAGPFKVAEHQPGRFLRGVFINMKLRQAFLAALDMDAILRAVYVHPALYHLDAGLEPRVSLWWTDVGQERYSQQDQAKARQLLQEAGYQGQPVRYMTAGNPRLALATKQQLEEVGFTVEFQMMDGATLLQRRDNPDLSV